jgi:hypothetical protein
VAGQPLKTTLLDFEYDPFAPTQAWQASSASAHYMTALTEEGAVYMETKSGIFSTATYSTEAWGVTRFGTGAAGGLAAQWTAMSDWTPAGGSADFWEPVFHGALAGGRLCVPGSRGTLLALDKQTGSTVARITPDATWDGNTFVASPVTVDASGRLYFTVLRLSGQHVAVLRPGDEGPSAGADGSIPSMSEFYGSDAVDSYLVSVDSHGSSRVASVAALLRSAPKPADLCETIFADADLPWPPSPTAKPPTSPCGVQRVALNAAPAVGPDGTIYLVTRAHFTSRYAYLVAIRSDLTLAWATSLRDRFQDGCGVPRSMGGQLEPNGMPGGCAVGAPYGVDPATNRPGAGRVLDDSSASPVVAPDGSIFYGAYTSYNYSQGHLMHFGADGTYLGAYPFGWDTTPAVYAHDRTYSIVTKDNHYGSTGSYCNDPRYCPTDRNASAPDYPEGYFVTQLSPELNVEWSLQATNRESCERGDGGAAASCVSDHPASFEWCVNAPAVDARGTVYASSEDGWLYAIGQGGTVKGRVFQEATLSAAYTPVSLDSEGRIYSQNSGHLFVFGR